MGNSLEYTCAKNYQNWARFDSVIREIIWCSFFAPHGIYVSYGDCLEVKREYYQNCSMLGCVTQCSQSAAHSYEQFLQVQQIGFVTLGPLRHA